MRTLYCIIVTYNGMQWIEKCLLSLRKSSWPVHAIVIDNGSSDDTCRVIKANFPDVQLIRSEKNLGFGQANNMGMKIALEKGAEFIFLLNQDAWIEKDTLSSLLDFQQTHPEFGIVSPVHLNGIGTAPDIYFLQYLRNSWINEVLGSVLLKKTFPSVVQTEFVNAAAWLLSAGCIKKTGGFDPIFFHYGEDLNYCQRVIYHGYKIGIHLESRICHDREQRISSSSKDHSAYLKSEWINLVNQFCDIRRPHYYILFMKRLLRYTLFMFLGIVGFKKDAIVFNFKMIEKMTLSIGKINNSRKSNISASLL